MALTKTVTIESLSSIQGGMAQFYTPQRSDETMLVCIPQGTIDDLFVHRYQKDQLLVVRGSFVLITLENRQYRYTYLTEDCPKIVTIPRGVPHGAVNLSNEDCYLINAVLKYGKPHHRDYQPIIPPFAYDFSVISQYTDPKF